MRSQFAIKKRTRQRTKMRWIVLASVALFMTVTYGFELDQSECDHNRVYNCVQPFYRNENLTEAIFPYTSEIKLRTVCRDFQVVDRCLSPMRESCTIHEEYHYLGIDGSFSFLCEEENIQAYLRHAECLGERNLWSKGQQCLREFYTSFYLYYANDKLCGYVDTYLDCNKAKVKSKCGGDAARWQYEINRRYLAAVIKDFDCKLGASRMSDGIIAAIIVVVVLVVVGIISVVIWVCRRQVSEVISRTRAQHLQHYSTQSNETQSGGHVTYPVTGHDQDITDYRLEYRQDLGEPADADYITGVINPGYTGAAANANSDDTTDQRQPTTDGVTGLGVGSTDGGTSIISRGSTSGEMMPAIQVTDTSPSKEADIAYNDVLIY